MSTGSRATPLIMALPNGRILGEVMPLLRRIGIEPEPAFDDPASRQLRFETSEPGLELIRVRSFDAATFVAFGAAQLGVAGNDVLMEFDYSEIYALLDLDIGHCRLAVAAAADALGKSDVRRSSHLRVATKYPEVTRRHFAARGIQAECIKLNGAIELAPRLGLCRHIVDLVQTGATLRANGLVEIEPIAEVSSRLIVNRPALKTRPEEVGGWIDRFREAVHGTPSPTKLPPIPSPASGGGSGRGLGPSSPAVRGRVKSRRAPPLSRIAGEGADHRIAARGAPGEGWGR